MASGFSLSNGLNIHATLRRGHDDGLLRSAVHQDGKIELAASELALADVDSIAETAGGAGLLGDQLVADHLMGKHLGLGGRVDDSKRRPLARCRRCPCREPPARTCALMTMSSVLICLATASASSADSATAPSGT